MPTDKTSKVSITDTRCFPRIAAGSESLGMWHVDTMPLECMSPLLTEWIKIVKDISRFADTIIIVDAGCGNAASSLPIIFEIARSKKHVKAYLIDSQNDAITATQKRIFKAKIPLNIQLRPERQSLELFQIPDKSHGITCLFVLHLLNHETRAFAIKALFNALTDGGVLLISVPSIYDMKNLEDYRNTNPNTDNSATKMTRLKEVLLLTNNGSTTSPMPNGDDFPQRMYFFTEPSIRKILSEVGFKNIKIVWERSIGHQNGLSGDYSETITALATKLPMCA